MADPMGAYHFHDASIPAVRSSEDRNFNDLGLGFGWFHLYYWLLTVRVKDLFNRIHLVTREDRFNGDVRDLRSGGIPFASTLAFICSLVSTTLVVKKLGEQAVCVAKTTPRFGTRLLF